MGLSAFIGQFVYTLQFSFDALRKGERVNAVFEFFEGLYFGLIPLFGVLYSLKRSLGFLINPDQF